MRHMVTEDVFKMPMRIKTEYTQLLNVCDRFIIKRNKNTVQRPTERKMYTK